MTRSHLCLAQARGDRPVWLRVGTLLDGLSTTPIRNAHIVYDREAIRFVGRDDSLPPAYLLTPGQSRPTLDLPETTLLPGLIEAHAHLFLEGAELDVEKRKTYLQQTPSELLQYAQTRLEPLLRLGVIAVRDAGDRDGVGLALSRLYRSDTRPLMPYVDSPGAAIYHKGRYGSFMGDPLEDHASPSDCVAARVRAGADRIKLIPTGIINFAEGRVTTSPKMSTVELTELVRAARAFDKQTFAHASGDEGIERAIEANVDSIEHGYFIRDDQLVRMRDRGLAWVPTFAPLRKQVDHAARMGWSETVITNLRRILDQHAESLVKAHALGVQIIAGSDAGSYGVAHGEGFLSELELMERAGLAPIAVINTATGRSSRRLGFKEAFGRICVGYRSRFILTEHSPLETVCNLRQDKVVVFDGCVYKSSPTSRQPAMSGVNPSLGLAEE